MMSKIKIKSSRKKVFRKGLKSTDTSTGKKQRVTGSMKGTISVMNRNIKGETHGRGREV